MDELRGKLEGEKEPNNGNNTSYREYLTEQSKAIEIKANIEASKIPFQRKMLKRHKLQNIL